MVSWPGEGAADDQSCRTPPGMPRPHLAGKSRPDRADHPAMGRADRQDERDLGWAGHTGMVRITIRVRPGSARPGVGGQHDGALVVRVRAAAVDGRATAAALAAVAAAFGVRPHAVTLVAAGQPDQNPGRGRRRPRCPRPAARAMTVAGTNGRRRQPGRSAPHGRAGPAQDRRHPGCFIRRRAAAAVARAPDGARSLRL